MSKEVGLSPKTDLEGDAKSTSLEYTYVDGLRIRNKINNSRPMKEQIDCIKALEMKEDDVIICAHPKCGTHWLWEIVSMLISGKAEYEKRAKEFAMMEAVEIESIQSLPFPRILNTHLPTRMLPAEVKDKKVKIIHIYRNPKDVIVSGYFGTKCMGVAWSLEDCVTASINTTKYIDILRSMDTFIEDNPEHPIFNVSFEELKQDHEGTVRRLGEFLGVKTTPELCADITRATSISNMREADKNKMHVDNRPKVEYRKGVVGDWKNHLTVAQSEAIDAYVKQLEGCRNLHFRYTL